MYKVELNVKKRFTSEKILLEELAHAGVSIKKQSRNLSIGELLKLVRLQLGMSQSDLSKRAGVPQATISRMEKGGNDCKLSTLEKISNALSCELMIAPILKGSIDSIRQMQAKSVATKHINYLKGTMHLEMQKPDDRFINELIKDEENALLHSPQSKLWRN